MKDLSGNIYGSYGPKILRTDTGYIERMIVDADTFRDCFLRWLYGSKFKSSNFHAWVSCQWYFECCMLQNNWWVILTNETSSFVLGWWNNVHLKFLRLILLKYIPFFNLIWRTYTDSESVILFKKTQGGWYNHIEVVVLYGNSSRNPMDSRLQKVSALHQSRSVDYNMRERYQHHRHGRCNIWKRKIIQRCNSALL